jgi:hypothetical protein
MGASLPYVMALATALTATRAPAETVPAQAGPATVEGARAFWPVPVRSRVRVSTASPLSGSGVPIEGRLEAIEGGVLVLAVPGGGRVRVGERDITRLEVREGGSTARAVLGGLAGVSAGFVAALLVCISAHETCYDETPFMIGSALGAAIGVAAGGAPEWRSVSLWHGRSLALTLGPRPRGAALGLSLSF